MARLRAPVAWCVDLNASPAELDRQATRLEEQAALTSRQHRVGGAPPGTHANSSHRKPLDFDLMGKVVENPLIFTEILCFAEVHVLGHLSKLRRGACNLFNNDGAWHAACSAVAIHSQLYMPSSYALGWRRLFWEQLWPARTRWSRVHDGVASDFQIRVGVRVRPGKASESSTSTDIPLESEEDPGFFLPLHQRLRLFRAGKLTREQLLQPRADSAELQHVLSMQGDLPPAVMDAVLRAQQVKNESYLLPLNPGTRDVSSVAADPQGDLRQDEPLRAGIDAGNLEASTIGSRASHVGNDDVTDEAATPESMDQTEESSASALERDIPKKRRGGNARMLAAQASRVTMYVPGQGARSFPFGRVLAESDIQGTVYSEFGHDMILSMFYGFNACLLCYGQTGSGKTHTMFGPDGTVEKARNEGMLPETAGIVLRAVGEVLELAGRLNSADCVSVSLTCQYVEIYNEQVGDLLGEGHEVQIRGPKAQLQGASEVRVSSLHEVLEVLACGQRRKHFAETKMNHRSSRAHTIFLLNMTQTNQQRGVTVCSTLHLVDLAGSEQLKMSGAEGVQMKEAIGINSSLFILGKVIAALVDGKEHVPYSESALTRLLRPALGGSSRTSVLVTCSPDSVHGEQTLSALRFGERCQRVVNRVALESVRTTEDALYEIDSALHTCKRALMQQKERGLCHLPAYRRLVDKYSQLQQARCSLESTL